MTKVEGDTIRPDRLQAAITGTISGMTISVQMISIGSVVYMTNPLSGKWEELPSQFAALSVFNPNSGITKIMRDIVNPIMVNKEQSGGVDCYHVSGSIDSESLSAMTGSSLKGTTVNVELWIGIDDFLLHNIKLAGKITETEVSGIVRTLTLSDFDKALTIELPE